MGKRLKRTSAFALVLLYQLSFSGIASAAGNFSKLASDSTSLQVNMENLDGHTLSSSENTWDIINQNIQLQANPVQYRVLGTYNILATGYTASPEQTDDSPCVAASGYNICTGDENVIAANFYVNGKRVPFGTLVRIPSVYGDKLFVVEDRMNSRYHNNIDILFSDIHEARLFGAQRHNIEIVEEI